MTSPEPGPYATAAGTYWEAGWRGILPIPLRQKFPPPDGWTGRRAAWPSYADLHTWVEDPGWAAGGGNIALRLPHHVIGLDVDAYGSKQGAATLDAAVQEWGELPATWRTTSRDDGASGIRLFRVPEGLAWPGELGPGVELIQWGHRYAVAWPSVHPEGRTYRWITPQGAVSTVVPTPDELPELPDSWLVGITGGVMADDTLKANLGDDQARAWLLSVNRPGMCGRMSWALGQLRQGLTSGGSRHAALRHVVTIVRMAEGGHPGVLEAVTAAHELFVRAATSPAASGGTRSAREAELEWARSLIGAINLVIGSPSVSTTVRADPCDDPLADLVGAPTPTAAVAATAAQVGSLAMQLDQQPQPTVGDTGEADDRLEAELERRRQEAQLLAQEVALQRARRAAKRMLDEEDASAQFREPMWARSLTDELALPDEPVQYTVDQLLPAGANVLLTAGFKTGKTTMMGHLTKCLVDGDPFLGKFPINDRPGQGRIGYFNYEVSRDQHRRWLRDLGIVNTDAVTVLPLRGFRLPLVSKYVEDWVVRWLQEHQIDVWIVDPYARAYVGSVTNENDNTEVGAFLDALDVIKERAGVMDLIMPVHTGRGDMEEGQERARGATRLDDWADVRWLLTKDEHDIRYFRATGRDVEYPESQLRFDEASRSLLLTGGNRQQGKRVRVTEAIIRAIEEQPGIGARALRTAVRADLGQCAQTALDEALELLEEQGRLRVEEGSGRKPRRHYLCPVEDLADGPVGDLGTLDDLGVGA